MSKSLIHKAIAKVAEDITKSGMSDLQQAAYEAAGGLERYLQYAHDANIANDVKAEKRAIRDANKAGMSDNLTLPGMEQGQFPIGIPVIRDGRPLSVHWTKATMREVGAEIKACRRENKAEDARISRWERTYETLQAQPESNVDATTGEVIAAIEMRQLAEAN